MRNRAINIYVIVSLFLLVGCISHQDSSNKVSLKNIELDNKVTEDKNIVTDNLLVKTKNSGISPEFFDIFRVDSSNPDSIVLYAHILDINRQMVRDFFESSGYKICGFSDNGRKIAEYEIEERNEETLPYNISFVLDHSGSIGEQRARQIQQAVINVIDLKLEKDTFSIIKFSKDIEETVKWNSNKSDLKALFPLNGLAGFGGATSLYDGILTGLKTFAGKGKGRGIIVITDGYDNTSEHSIQDMLTQAVDEGINIFTVGFGDNIDKGLLEYTSQRTGGKFYHIHKTEEFSDVFRDIYYRLNSYYTIKYKVINRGRHEVVISLCKENRAIKDTIVFFNDEIEDCDMIMSLETRGVLPDKTEVYEPEITIWERASREHHPLIPFIFFDKNSSEIPSRYFKRSTNEILGVPYGFIKSNERIDIYYDILNILGQRWQVNKNAVITLTGCNDGIEGGLALSLARADAVKSYLTQVCNIPQNFIITKAGGLPPLAQLTTDSKAILENRRVEIETSDDEFLLAPFIFENLTYDASPPILRTYVDILNRDIIHHWSLQYLKDNTIIRNDISLASSPASIIDYKISTAVKYNRMLGKYLITGADNIQLQLIVYLDSLENQQCATKKKNIKIIQNTIEEIKRKCLESWQIENFSLVLFDMNKSNYDDKAIYGYLKKIFSVKYDRPVIFDVYGHTCDIGTYQENLTLSKKRANTIASIIKKYIRDNNLNGIVREIDGEAWVIMDLFYKLEQNDHPERRLYSRNANVTAYLPISCDSIQLKQKGD